MKKANVIIGLIFIVVGGLSVFIDGYIIPCVMLGMIGTAVICTKENIFDI